MAHVVPRDLEGQVQNLPDLCTEAAGIDRCLETWDFYEARGRTYHLKTCTMVLLAMCCGFWTMILLTLGALNPKP